MFFDVYSKLCIERGKSPNTVAKELGIASGTITEWKKGRVPQNANLRKISEYFGVTVDYLLGKEDEKKPAEETAGEEEVKVALFGGAEEVTDEMWEEVKRFAEFIKQKYKK